MTEPAKVPSACCLTPEETARSAESIMAHKTAKPFVRCVLMSVSAGVFIALAFMFYATVLADGNGKLAGGLCFSIGLMFCVLFGCELFTSSTMTVIAKYAGLATWKQVLKNWGVVYSGNFVGALLMVFLVMAARQYEAFDGAWGRVILDTALHKVSHIHPGEPYWRGFVAVMTLGVFCNMMVCGAVWLSFAGKTLTDRILTMIFPVALFVASGFEHSIANMFLIPAGICVLNFAGAEFWQAAGQNPDQFADLTIINFIVNNLIPVTVGNIIGGGLMIGLYNWYANCRAGGVKA